MERTLLSLAIGLFPTLFGLSLLGFWASVLRREGMNALGCVMIAISNAMLSVYFIGMLVHKYPWWK